MTSLMQVLKMIIWLILYLVTEIISKMYVMFYCEFTKYEIVDDKKPSSKINPEMEGISLPDVKSCVSV